MVNIFDPELQLTNTKPDIKNKLKGLLSERVEKVEKV